MRKSKRGPGLFDVLERNEVNRTPAPSRRTTASDGPVPVDKGEAASVDHGPRAGTPPADRRTPNKTAERNRPDHESPLTVEPIVKLVGDRIRVSLNSLSMAVGVFGLLVLVFGAFETGRHVGDGGGFRRGHAAGRASYAADALTDIEAARSQPPAVDVVEALRPEPVGGGGPVPAGGGAPQAARPSEGGREPSGTTWIRGYTYIVVQEFGVGREDDARRAKAFLAERGVGTEIVRYRNDTIQLITTQGFNRRDSTQNRLADELLERVHALGAQYMAAGGGYRLEGYFRSLKGGTW